MTVIATIPRVLYVAGAAQTIFPYPFPIGHAGQLRVYANDALLTLSVHYNVTGVGSDEGGNVITTTGAPAGMTIVITRGLAIDQNTDYIEHNPFPALAHEEGLDKLTGIAQELQEQLNRTPRLKPSTMLGAIELPDPSTLTLTEAGKKALVWNDAGTNLSLVELVQQIGLVGDVIPVVATFETLPAPGNEGRLHIVSGLNALYYDQGGIWHAITSIDELVIPATTRASLPDPTLIIGRARLLSDAPQALAISNGAVWIEWPINGIVSLAGHAFNALPTASPAGQLARVTDSVQGLALSDGTRWTVVNAPVYRPENMAGADLGAKINALMAMMPATGGTIDARSFNGPQTATATIALTKPTTLLLGEVVLTSTASPIFSVTASPCTIEGLGAGVGVQPGSTVIKTTTPTQTAIDINQTQAYVKNLLIDHAGADHVSGYGIHVQGPPNQCSVFSGLTINGQHTAIKLLNSQQWTVKDCHILNSVAIGLHIDNPSFMDSGDAQVYGCLFNSAYTNAYAVYQNSGGGLKFFGNKILEHFYGMAMDISGTTGVLLITNNSIENQRGSSIYLTRTAGSSTFNQVIIANNQINNSLADPINLVHEAITFVAITGNLLSYNSPFVGVRIDDVQGAYIQGNMFGSNGGASTGIFVAAAASLVHIGENYYVNVGTPILNQSTTTIIGASSVQVPADGQVGLQVQRNLAGVVSMAQVFFGPPNSGGAGLRQLTIVN